MKIGIGIDTGGTCTDVVAYDFDSETILAKGKALTTHEDLTIGVHNALGRLPDEFIKNASVVSLSTTLATNACVEGKGGRAKLIIFGLTDEVIERYRAVEKYGFTPGCVRCIDTHGSADGLKIDQPDWDWVEEHFGDWISDGDALSTAELYALNNGAPCEKMLKKISREKFDTPCICANEISTELNVLVRGATALLNARLMPVMQNFIESVSSDLTARGCHAPIMIVRSDGSLMSSKLLSARPVETILSGPAASVISGKFFSGKSDYAIVDMGGTTTDVSVVCDGKPIVDDDGIRIGGWRTSVQGVFVEPFALGGDSAVRLHGDHLELSNRRVTPLCSAACRWPEIKEMLTELLDSRHYNQFPLHEFFCLTREPSSHAHYEPDELRLIDALRSGPCILEKLKERADIDLYYFKSERLESEGIIMRCGLTPTDFMHIKGDYTEYDAEASQLACRYLLRSLQQNDTPEAVISMADTVYELVEEKLYTNLLRTLLGRRYPKIFEDGVDNQLEFLLHEAWRNRSDTPNPLLRCFFNTDMTLVGIGAPTHIFLPEVSKALGVECVLPEHAEVANAIGAIRADINIVVSVKISQGLSTSGEIFYVVHTPEGSTKLRNLDEAIKIASVASEKAALTEAHARGAVGKLDVKTYVENHSALSRWGVSVSLGSTVVSEVALKLSPDIGSGS